MEMEINHQLFYDYYLGNNMKGVEQQLQHLSGSIRLCSLAQSILQSDERALNSSPEALDLVAELKKRSTHAKHRGIHVDQFGGEVDKVGIITVDEVDEFMVERREMGLELRSEGVEWNKGSELRNVGFGVEVRREEQRGLEPQRVGVERIGEEIRGRSWGWRWDLIRHFPLFDWDPSRVGVRLDLAYRNYSE